ncbi:MAG: transcriptional regulator [Candidatus Diapherotrites archaeon]
MALRFPCEMIGWYVLPAVRSELVGYLVEKKKLSRKDVAKRIGLTEAAVCQYLGKKRGKRFKFSKKELGLIKELGESIAEAEKRPELTFLSGTCALCKEVRKEKALCRIHKIEDTGLSGCNICFDA